MYGEILLPRYVFLEIPEDGTTMIYSVIWLFNIVYGFCHQKWFAGKPLN
jgi:hypothetical protein